MPEPTRHRPPIGQALALLTAAWLLAGCSGDPAAKPGFHDINQHRFFINSLFLYDNNLSLFFRVRYIVGKNFIF